MEDYERTRGIKMTQNMKKQEILTYIESRLSQFPEGESSLEAWYEWREACLLAINEGLPVQEIINLSIKMLNNPIALFDSALNMIAYAGDFQGDVRGTIWELLLNTGYSRPELFPAEERKQISEWLESSQETFRFYSDVYPGNEHVAIKCNAGMLCFIDLNGPISDGEQYLVEELAHFLESAMRHSGTIFAGHSDTFYIERLLRGMNVRQTAFARHMRYSGWSTEGDFCVYTVSGDDSNSHLKNAYLKRLRDRLQRMIILPYEDLIVMISRDPGPVENEKILNIAEQLQLKVGCSAVFHQLMNLHFAYIQGNIAKSYAHSGQLVIYENIYLNYCLESLQKMTETKALCYPNLLELKESEDKTAGELIHDLRTYLMLGCDIAETARQTHIHRNTLLYRLEKLERLLGVSLKNPDTDIRFYLLMSTLLLDSDNGGE